jgi:GWxTD domain-containing protein
MTPKVITLCLLCLYFSSTAYCIDAVSTTTTFYKKNKQNGYDANVMLNWEANANSLHFDKNTKGELTAQIIVLLRISNDTGVLKEQTMIFETSPKSTLEACLTQKVSNLQEYILPNGHYELELVLAEKAYPKAAYQYSGTVEISEAPKNKPFISGIQLLDTFFASTTPSVYTRNGKLDLPLASNYFDEHHSSIKFYTEIYQAETFPKEKLPLKLNTYISWKEFSTPVPSFEQKDSVENTAFMSVHQSFPLATLASGNYYLNAVLSDKNDAVIDKKSIFLQRFNAHPVEAPKAQTKPITKKDSTNSNAQILDLTTTFVGKYTAEQVHAILKMLKVICTPDEGIAIDGFLKKPDELYTKYFIYNFFEKRNKNDPSKAWKEYVEQIREVNKMFGGSNQRGFETDRGRVYIKYGKPSDRILVPNESGALPYEIWQYNFIEKQGVGVIFLFYKPGSAMGDYSLLYSTLIGERRNSNWRSLLYSNSISGAGSANQDSQAEQYLRNK